MPADPGPHVETGSQHRITLLGPQRDPRLDQVVRGLGLTGGRFATITAGWRDRESDDALLTEQLGTTVNLGLWQRMQHVWEVDPELAAGDRRRRILLTEMQELYLVGLEQAVAGIARLRSHTPRSERVRNLAIQDAYDIMRGMDARHLERVADLHASFYAKFQPEHRESVVEARFRVGQLIGDCDAVVIPGGHVGVLLGALHLFNLAPGLASPGEAGTNAPGAVETGVVESGAGETGSGERAPRDVGTSDVGMSESGTGEPGTATLNTGTLDTVTDGAGAGAKPAPVLHRPIIAWGAGAMALTERVVLFYDNAVARPGVAEMFMEGLGLTRDVVALPSPKERLDLKNLERMQSIPRRCAPSLCLLLDTRAEVTLTAGGRLPVGARIVGADGSPTTYEGPVATSEDTHQPAFANGNGDGT